MDYKKKYFKYKKKYLYLKGGKIKNCCQAYNSDKVCIRKSDNKKFKLPRKFSKNKCKNNKIKGFSMKSSCAPYSDCKKK